MLPDANVAFTAALVARVPPIPPGAGPSAAVTAPSEVIAPLSGTLPPFIWSSPELNGGPPQLLGSIAIATLRDAKRVSKWAVTGLPPSLEVSQQSMTLQRHFGAQPSPCCGPMPEIGSPRQSSHLHILSATVGMPAILRCCWEVRRFVPCLQLSGSFRSRFAVPAPRTSVYDWARCAILPLRLAKFMAPWVADGGRAFWETVGEATTSRAPA